MKAVKKLKNYSLGLYIRFRGRPSVLKAAIRRADGLHKKTGRRYRVFFFGYRYRVWTRSDIKERIRSGLFRNNLKCGADFDAICFYDTNPNTPVPCS